MTTREWVLAVAGAVAAVGTIWGFVRVMVGPAARIATREAVTAREVTFADRVLDALRQQAPAVKAWLEELFQREIATRDETARVARENTGKLAAMEHSLNALSQLPGAVAQMTRAVEGLERAVEKLGTDTHEQGKDFATRLEQHGREVSKMQGQLEAIYTGPERRHTPRRRATDPEP